MLLVMEILTASTTTTIEAEFGRIAIGCECLQSNLGYDKFIIHQLAGDLLPNPTLEELIATVFNRNNVTTNENGIIEEEVAVMYAKDRADTTSAVFLGLTTGCATCHDHRFDPISQKDHYALEAFFNNTTQMIMDDNRPDAPPIMFGPERGPRSVVCATTPTADITRSTRQRAQRKRCIFRPLVKAQGCSTTAAVA
jgi:hypothetical protein